MTLESFIENSLNSNTCLNTFEISILEDACKAIKKHTNLNICSYKFVIQEEYVRHVRNRHEEDLDLLTKIPDILNYFNSVEKSITQNKQTKRNEVSLVFRKKFDDDIVRMVALRVMRGKILSLKTLFRQ